MEDIVGRFKQATEILDQRGLDYLVFGGVAVWAYGRRRPTKDIDLLVRPEEADSVLEALDSGGFATERTDDSWLFKASRGGADIDIVFQTKGISLSNEILSRKRQAELDGRDFDVIDPENLVLVKILSKKEIRPADWYDALSIIRNLGRDFDWPYFTRASKPFAPKVLSFLFFVQGKCLDHQEALLVPDSTIDMLFGVYRTGRSNIL